MDGRGGWLDRVEQSDGVESSVDLHDVFEYRWKCPGRIGTEQGRNGCAGTAEVSQQAGVELDRNQWHLVDVVGHF
jgi:hypothetical protein